MDKLLRFIEHSKVWSSSQEDKEALSFGASFLKNKLDIHSGFISLQHNPVVTYEQWGHSSGVAEPQAFFKELVECGIETCQWIQVRDCPDLLRQHVMASFIGVWPLSVCGQELGLFVLGCEHIDPTEEQIITLSAMHLSVILDAIHYRRAIEQISHVDALTGLLNRTGFQASFPSLLSTPSDVNDPLLIGILDLDDFKMINDFYGHLHGDKILHRIAKHLKDCVGDRGLCARWGGDEMIFAWRPTLSTEDAEASLTEALSPSLIGCYVSIGTAVWGVDGDEWDLCFACADQRLYEKKLERATMPTTF